MVLVERGKLLLAAQCLERTARMAPHQDYVLKHLAIVKARIYRLPRDKWDNEIFDDSLWMTGTAGNDRGYINDLTDDQFLGEINIIFVNHAIIYDHVGNKKSDTNPLANHIVNLKDPSAESVQVMNDITENTRKIEGNQQKVVETANLIEPPTSEVFDKILTRDVTELEISKQLELMKSDQFSLSAQLLSGTKHTGKLQQTEDSKLS